MKLRIFLFAFAFLLHNETFAQGIQGKILSDDGPYDGFVSLFLNQKLIKIKTDKNGKFLAQFSDTGIVILTIDDEAYKKHSDTFQILNKKVISIADIALETKYLFLKEVEISKFIAVSQDNDTTIFNSDAYKVNVDADASDLIRKIPSMELNGTEVKFQGEQVTKVLVDGRPFFGNNPYQSLKVLPGSIIKSVKVYDEKSGELDQFTGFRESATTKTINIITKAGVDKSLFGSMSTGVGKDNGGENVYSSDATLNKFAGRKRLTGTAQKNNINSSNLSAPTSTFSSGGVPSISKLGFNYTDSLFKKSDLALNYSFNNTQNKMETNLNRTYFTAIDSGQVYKEQNVTNNSINSHSASLKLNVFVDSLTSLLIQPQLTYSEAQNLNSIVGNTTRESFRLNNTLSSTAGNQKNTSFQNTLLLKKRFTQKGRTFSFNFGSSYFHSNNHTDLNATNSYFVQAKSDTLNQRNTQSQSSPNLSAELNYTEPLGEKSLLKFLLHTSYSASTSKKIAGIFSDNTNSYSVLDSNQTGDLMNKTMMQKIGSSYMHRFNKAIWSVNAQYQFTEIDNTSKPVQLGYLNQSFNNLLLSTDFQYQLSKQQFFKTDYSAQTQTPTVNQFQNLINNNSPLHLTIGNPTLRQSIRHLVALKYNSVKSLKSSNFNASANIMIVQNQIASNTIITTKDSLLNGNINLPAGASLTIPVNLNGAYTLSFYLNYGKALSAINSNFNIGLTAAQNTNLAMINGMINRQINQNFNIRGQLSSNISERLDFTLQTITGLTYNTNSLNTKLSRNFINNNLSGTINLVLPKKLLINTAFSYQSNSGLRDGYNQNYVLWNLSIGKKIFKRQQGDIRISVFDLLNNNKNIRYTVSSEYEQATQTTILQRYFILMFSYKIRSIR